jgi:hypothetical protein
MNTQKAVFLTIALGSVIGVAVPAYATFGSGTKGSAPVHNGLQVAQTKPGDNSEGIRDRMKAGDNSEGIKDRMKAGDNSESIKDRMKAGDNSESIKDRMKAGDNSEDIKDRMKK